MTAGQDSGGEQMPHVEGSYRVMEKKKSYRIVRETIIFSSNIYIFLIVHV